MKGYTLLFIPFLFVIIQIESLNAQKGVTSFGMHYNRMLPIGLLNTDGETVTDQSNGSTLDINIGEGYNLGGIVRFGISDMFALESGINLVQRKSEYILNSKDFPKESSVQKFRGYEIPLNLLVFIRLTDKMYMNASGGVSVDFYPTGGVAIYKRDTIEFGTVESNWLQFGVNAGLGYEYRSEHSGIFYFGAYYHVPVQDMATIYVSKVPYYTEQDRLISPPTALRGSYLSLELRYYFHAEKKERNKKKKDRE